MGNKPMIAVAAAVLAVGIALAWYFHTRSAPAPHEPAARPPPAAAPAGEGAIEHPVPETASSSAAPLPTLAESDSPMRDALAQVAGADAATQFLVPESIIRHIVVTVDNLPRQKVPAARRPVMGAPGAFLANGDELHATLDPRNYARYEPMVAVLRRLDMHKTADVYFHFYPLFQQVYQDLGYPQGYFNDRLVQVIDSLLATPEVSGPLELTRPNVLYVYADPSLEARPAGQKLLLRMGPDNAAVIKAKLKELRAIVTASPPPRH